MILLILILIGSAILGLYLIDISLIGFVPKAMGIWSPLAELDTKDFLLVDTIPTASIRTNIKTKSGKDVIFERNVYNITLTALLTKKYFIIRNTRLTYLLALKIELIDSFTIKQHLFRKIIIFHVIENNEKKFFQFSPKNYNLWIKEFSKIGLKLLKSSP